MRARGPHRRAAPRPLAAWAVALALLLRLPVPQGWMPVATGDAFRLVPCSGAGPMVMAGHGGGRHHAPGQAVDGSCPFAAAAVPLLGAAPPPLLPPAARLAVTTPAPRTAAAVGRGLAAPPPPATGPPHSA